MKINMYGGVLTMSYNLAKLLRRKGMDVTLFVDRDVLDRSYSPVWEDEELKSGYPDWMRVVDAKFSRALLGNKTSMRFAKDLSDCDILHLHGEAYLWANLFTKPFIFHSYGYDLDQMPFKSNTVKLAALSFFSRRGIKRAAKIIVAPHQNVFLEKLKVSDKGMYVPWPMDLDKYNTIDAGKLRQEILKRFDADFIFFHPTRHEWSGDQTTNNKRNDKLIHAFAAYIKDFNKRAVLILVNKGGDVGETRKLIEGYGIGDRIEWLDAMPKSRLIEYYSASDVVLDQFELGWFGQIFLESMACGKPTITYLKYHERIYPEAPPAVNALTSDDILKDLIKLTSDKDLLASIGRQSREWINKYHSWNNVCGLYRQLYESLSRSQ
jgi:glycosyltransferase involved in cell wall biosynthesis